MLPSRTTLDRSKQLKRAPHKYGIIRVVFKMLSSSYEPRGVGLVTPSRKLRFGSNCVCGWGCDHCVHLAGLSQKFRFNILHAATIRVDRLVSKNKRLVFDGDQLTIVKRFAWIDNVGEFDRSRFNNRRITP